MTEINVTSHRERAVLQVGNTKINILLYADAMVLLAENEENLQSLLDIMSEWCYKWRLKANKSKTKIFIFVQQEKPLQTLSSNMVMTT